MGKAERAKFLGQRKGGMPQMSLEFTLRKHSIDPHKDLKLIQNIDFANVASAFGSGTGDYVQLFEPQASILKRKVVGGLLPLSVWRAASCRIRYIWLSKAT